MALPKVGDILDIFILRSELHSGPLANIFLAEDLLTDRQVVLKIPCCDILNQPVLLYHYQNEDRISRRLDHPGIIRFIQRQKSRQYIIMEFARGRDLRARIGSRRILELNQALALMTQLGRVVAYLHAQGIVHLDLKPENIICTDSSGIKLIDFGLASCRDLPDLLTLDLNNPLGTPWYIAPEQLLGERSDPRCDIYSMGMLLYEMLTGRLPWPRTSKLRIARKRLRHDPTPPRYYNKAIPARIQSIILRALARRPNDRYDNVTDLQHDLAHWRQLPITERGKAETLPPLWRRLFPGKSIQVHRQQPGTYNQELKPQLIGGLIDVTGSDNMLAEIKKQALIRRADITLVHVIEEESDSHFRRYGITVEGEKLMVRLEHAVQLLRRCSLDPSIRLIRGEAVEVLQQLCTDLNAELLVLAGSRKKEGLLCSASVCRRLENNSSCPVVVAAEPPFAPLTELAKIRPNSLTAEQALAYDIFLVDLWFEHLHDHTDFIYQQLLHPDQNSRLNEKNCLFGRFLSSLDAEANWQRITSLLGPIHIRFHQLADQMAACCSHDPAGLQDLYMTELLPLSCSLKNELAQVSLILRADLDAAPPEVPFLTDNSCPFNKPELACYGPLLRAFNLQQDLSGMVEKNSPQPSAGNS